MTNTPKPPTRGIVLIALKNAYYVRAAFNLAVSLRQPDNGAANIMLITQESIFNDLNSQQKWLFPKKKFLSDVEAENPFLVKLMLPTLSPYDETLYIDVDTVWLPNKKVSWLFDELSTTDFAIANRGYIKKTEGQDDKGYDWALLSEMFKATGTDQFLDVASEVIYFRKTDAVKGLFETAMTFYLTNSIVNKFIGGHQPDEPSLAYAIEKTGIKPHAAPFFPSYWHRHNNQRPRRKEDIYNNYYLLSMGGSAVRDDIRKLYNGLMHYYTTKIGQPFYYPHENKNVRQYGLKREVI